MDRRLTRFLFVMALTAALLGTTTASASAAGLDEASALRTPAARQALASGACPGAIRLDASAPLQEEAMQCLVNQAREQRGLSPLTESSLLRTSAIDKGGDLIRCNEFSHTACGREFSYWIRETGYLSSECWRAGENLAWGVDGQGTVGSIFRAWMRSPTHRANILGDFEESGMELKVGSLGGLSGVHVWVQHFGSHCG